MPTLVTNFNWGTALYNENRELTRQLAEAYTNTAQVVNIKVSKAVRTTDPPANDPFNANYEIGDVYVNTSSNSAWMLTSRTSANAVTWTIITT